MKQFLRLIATVCVAGLVCGFAAPKDDVEKRVEKLLAKMTLEEKIGQMNQLSFSREQPMVSAAKEGKVGSILNLVDPAVINRIQRAAVEESRLGIPVLFSRDVIHGFKTIFPIPLGLAASFDPEMVEAGARVAAEEATAAGIRWTFSPMLD
ncbi:MAG: glycosyl hydrolase, partial [Tidjanibacter sp.]|nr:glycosyl hydrolase [Tidjanibacter sp.]